ncbi:MAG: ribbon-helix-helix domain-containing protein [Acidobacteriota bacterium]
MSHTISVRLTPELAEWLETTSERTGLPQSKIVRHQLERARVQDAKPFMELAGVVKGRPKDLSTRKGFSPK